jgi:hypothetical protein
MAQVLATNGKKQSAKVPAINRKRKGKAATQDRTPPRCLAVSEKGINTVTNFSNFFSLMIGDLVAGRITAGISNAACNAGAKLLKAVEMQERYGKPVPGQNKSLVLSPGPMDSLV